MKKYSAEWWQLYTGKEGVEQVAVTITAHLNDRCIVACTNMIQDDGYTAEKAGKWIYREMIDILLRYSVYGAFDSEPRAKLCNWIYDKFNVQV